MTARWRWSAPVVAGLLLAGGIFVALRARDHERPVAVAPTRPAPAAPFARAPAHTAVCLPTSVAPARGLCAAPITSLPLIRTTAALLAVDAGGTTGRRAVHVVVAHRQPDGSFATVVEWTDTLAAGDSAIQYPLGAMLSPATGAAVAPGVYRIALTVDGGAAPPYALTIRP